MRDFFKWAFDGPHGTVWIPLSVTLLGVLAFFIWYGTALAIESGSMLILPPLVLMWLIWREYQLSKKEDE